jgi:hypothetical protein
MENEASVTAEELVDILTLGNLHPGNYTKCHHSVPFVDFICSGNEPKYRNAMRQQIIVAETRCNMVFFDYDKGKPADQCWRCIRRSILCVDSTERKRGNTCYTLRGGSSLYLTGPPELKLLSHISL